MITDSVAGMIIAPPMPIARAQHDQLVGVLGERGEHARDAEQHEPGLQRALATEAVAERAHREQDAGEGEQVGVDDPLQRRARRREVRLQRRQRDVEDRVVEPDDEQAEGEHAERLPAARVHPRVDGFGLHGGLRVRGWSWDVDVADRDHVGARSDIGRQQRKRRAADSPPRLATRGRDRPAGRWTLPLRRAAGCRSPAKPRTPPRIRRGRAGDGAGTSGMSGSLASCACPNIRGRPATRTLSGEPSSRRLMRTARGRRWAWRRRMGSLPACACLRGADSRCSGGRRGPAPGRSRPWRPDPRAVVGAADAVVDDLDDDWPS